MKRVLLAAVLFAPAVVWAQVTAKDPFTQGSVEAGAAKAATCAACHGPAGNSSNAEWPKMAGQGARYTYDQLLHFKSGERKDPLMTPMAAPLSDEDMRDLAAYFAAQPASPGVASPDVVATAQKLYRAGNAAKGITACAACHLPNGAGVSAAGYPRIGGQHAVYVAKRLQAYRAAAETELEDGNYKIMAEVAAKLSDAEIEALASYVNGLH